VFINQYFHGLGDGRRQIGVWGHRSAAVDTIVVIH
jgi:hypothetical protein